VVVLLELPRRWSAEPPRRPVWLVAFDQEEWAVLGSRVLAAQLYRRQQALDLMVSLEMLSYTCDTQHCPHEEMSAVFGRRGDYIALVGNIEASPLLEDLEDAMG